MLSREEAAASDAGKLVSREQQVLSGEEQAADAGLPDNAWMSKKSLLVVDDEPEMTEYVARLFEDRLTVYQAGNGKEGLAMAIRLFPDIIISDIKMQEGNGIELCKAIKENDATDHIPVILLDSDLLCRIKAGRSGGRGG